MTVYKRIVVLTGAGLSAESGLGTFRDEDGLWTKYDLEDVATPEGFVRNPAFVHEFYNARRAHGRDAEANAAHRALARLEREHPGEVLVVTQNIDRLHEAAGSRNVIHMHGDLGQAMCAHCGARHEWLDDLGVETACPACNRAGGMRPDVVWFGEMPYRMDEISEALMGADLFVSIGTSGTVYPAAGFVMGATEAGAKTVELNLEPSEGVSYFDESRQGPATEIVPAFVNEVLGAGSG